MKKTVKIICILLVLLFVAISGCFSGSEDKAQSNGINTTEQIYAEENTSNSNNQNEALELTLSPSELRVGDGDVFRLQLSLKNNGSESVNVVRPKQYLSFEIINADGSDIQYQRSPGTTVPSDGNLVRLDPGESINATFSSREWWTGNGEHELSARYFVTDDWLIEAPHWSGMIRANNVTLIVDLLFPLM